MYFHVPGIFSYPAVVVVPEGTSDDTLISVATQFQHNRFPVVTWKNPNRQAVLLRSGCFVASNISQKISPFGNLPNTVLQGKTKFIGIAGKFGVSNKDKGAPQTNLPGAGVFSIDVEGYIRDIMHLSQNSRRKRHKSNLIIEVSGAPEMMHFDPDHTTGQTGSRSGSGKVPRVRSYGSDDADFSPQRQGEVKENDFERSITPEPQVDRLYRKPQPLKKEKRRFTVSNVFQKVRSPHFGRRKHYRAASSSQVVASTPEQCQSPLHEARGSTDVTKRLQDMRLPLEEHVPFDGEEGEEKKGGGDAEKGREGGKEVEGEGGEGGERVVEGRERVVEERERVGEGGEGRSSDEKDLTSSEGDSLERVRRECPEELAAMSPTQGIPKTYSLKKSASFSDLISGHDEVDIDDIEMRESRASSATPEPMDSLPRKSTIDWEAVGGEGEEPSETLPSDDSRPSTSTPEHLNGPGSKLDEGKSRDRSSGVWSSPRKQTAGHVSTLSVILCGVCVCVGVGVGVGVGVCLCVCVFVCVCVWVYVCGCVCLCSSQIPLIHMPSSPLSSASSVPLTSKVPRQPSPSYPPTHVTGSRSTPSPPTSTTGVTPPFTSSETSRL